MERGTWNVERKEWASWTSSLQQQPIVPVALIMLAAAALRFYHLGVQPLWLDESLTWLYAGAQHHGVAGQDVHPPLYYSLVRLWMHGVPGLGIPPIASQDNEFFLRVPSAVLGVLTVPLVYALGRTIGGARLAAVAALFFAIAPFQIRYAQEARMYALLTFLAALTMWGVSTLLAPSRPEDAEAGSSGADSPSILGRKRALPAWIAVVAGSVGALYTHNTAILLLVSWNLVLVIGRLDRRNLIRNWSLALGAIVLCWIPWLPRMAGQARAVLADYWIPAPDLNRVIETLGALYLPLDEPFPLYVGTSLLVTGLWALGLFQWRRNHRWAVFLLVLVAAPITGIFLVSLVQPVFLARTLIWTTIPFYVTLAAGALSLKHRPLRILVLFAVVGLNLWGVADYYTSYEKESWDEAADYVASKAAAGDVILIHKNYVKEPFNYYFRKYESAVPQHPLRGNASEIEAQIRALPPHKRIWLVASHGPLEKLYDVLKVLVKVGELREEKPLVGLNVFLFDATSGAAEAPGREP